MPDRPLKTPLTPSSLGTRLIILFLMVFLGGFAASYSVFIWQSGDVIQTLGGWFAERNVLYEKSRVLGLLSREIVLSQQMARSPVLRAWVAREDDPTRKRAALAELEQYRQAFRSRSYFMTLAESGHYYSVDEKLAHTSDFDPRQPRYTLSRAIPKDTWFYATLEQVEDYQLNVDTDRYLGVTRVWINTVMRDDTGAHAVLGTGVDLSDFIASVINTQQPGVINILLDREGAIQAHKDVAIIDFASIRRSATGEKRSTIHDLVESQEDRTALRQAMDELTRQGEARIVRLGIQGRNYSAGITYLPEVKWYLVTLTHAKLALDQRMVSFVALLLLLTLGLTLALVAFWLRRVVILPLGQLDAAARAVAEGRYDFRLKTDQHCEIGRLASAFQAMAERVRSNTAALEQQVAARTHALEELANTDFLTGFLNRRGLFQNLGKEIQRAARHDGKLGLLMLDLDHFKRVNDEFGHEVGDRALTHLADTLRRQLRAYDLAARWGGEEFLVVASDLGRIDELLAIAEKLRQEIATHPMREGELEIGLSVSIGAYLASPDEHPDTMIQRADNLLYRAKQNGRDRICF